MPRAELYAIARASLQGVAPEVLRPFRPNGDGRLLGHICPHQRAFALDPINWCNPSPVWGIGDGGSALDRHQNRLAQKMRRICAHQTGH
jgi:hypothetical protein